jgi:hypothetical protein
MPAAVMVIVEDAAGTVVAGVVEVGVGAVGAAGEDGLLPAEHAAHARTKGMKA